MCSSKLNLCFQRLDEVKELLCLEFQGVTIKVGSPDPILVDITVRESDRFRHDMFVLTHFLKEDPREIVVYLRNKFEKDYGKYPDLSGSSRQAFL